MTGRGKARKTVERLDAGEATGVKESSLVSRRSASDMLVLKAQILNVAEEIRDGGTITLRQLFYALTVRGILPKTEGAYKQLGRITSAMRRAREMPYAIIEDGTRATYVPATYESAQAALTALAERYLESPWTGAEIAPEIWLEKDALAGVVYDVTYGYCVPLRVQRGYASLSALYRAARDIYARLERGTRTQVYYLRDLDPSGADAARAAEATVREMLRQIDEDGVYSDQDLPPFIILGVTPEQVRRWNLPTRPNKASDSRTAAFEHDSSVELDAIHPPRLKRLVRNAIERHLPEAARLVHEAEVESTRAYLTELAVQAEAR